MITTNYMISYFGFNFDRKSTYRYTLLCDRYPKECGEISKEGFSKNDAYTWTHILDNRGDYCTYSLLLDVSINPTIIVEFHRILM